MGHPILLAFALVLLAGVLVGSRELGDRRSDWHWYLTGYVPAALRVVTTWRKVARLNDLAVSYGSNRRALGGLAVKGTPLRLRVPRLTGVPPLPNGLVVRARLLPGANPGPVHRGVRSHGTRLAHARGTGDLTHDGGSS
jgi:S-DNA-T family DNA segregation ATPase FtsK/SpoIIIE